MLEKKSINKSNKKGELPFAVFTSMKIKSNREMGTENMQLFTNIIEERIQNKLRRNTKQCKNQINKKE